MPDRKSAKSAKNIYPVKNQFNHFFAFAGHIEV
jgi:hypothetical protein